MRLSSIRLLMTLWARFCAMVSLSLRAVAVDQAYGVGRMSDGLPKSPKFFMRSLCGRLTLADVVVRMEAWCAF